VGLTISIHAREQAEKRGISEDGIIAILTESPAVTVLSKTDAEAMIVFGKYEGKVWGVVINLNTKNVITVRLASKKERRFYEQKTGN